MGRELAERGYAVSFVTLDHGQGKETTLGPFRVHASFRPRSGWPLLRFFHPRLTATLRALQAADADIYYVRCAGSIIAPVVHFARRHGKKVVFAAANRPDFDRRRLKLPSRKDRFLYFWGLRRADAIVVQNHEQLELLWRNFRLPGEIVHNGYLPVPAPEKQGRRNILWVANIKKAKRPQLFVELARRIPDQQFVMVGGSFDRRPAFEKLISERARAVANLQFKGYLPFQAVEKEFDQAALFINTSDYEGFPNTFLQAWARGIPVISFVDPDGLIAKHHLGLVVKDLEQMTAAVKHCRSNPARFDEADIRQCFNEHFTIRKTTDACERIFRSLLA